MISFLIEWISWIIYLNKNYTYIHTYIHTYLYIKLYIHTYLYIIWKRKFGFLLTTLYCTTWLFKFMPRIHLKTPNNCVFSFFNRHIFGVYAFFSFNGHIFIQNAHFSFNRHIFNQQAPFDISNMKGYNISICTFWYI